MSFVNTGSSFQSLLAVASFLGLVFFPIYWAKQFVDKFSQLQSRYNRERFLEFYVLLSSTKGRIVVLYPLYFMLRRLLFGAAIVLLSGTVAF